MAAGIGDEKKLGIVAGDAAFTMALVKGNNEGFLIERGRGEALDEESGRSGVVLSVSTASDDIDVTVEGEDETLVVLVEQTLTSTVAR